MQAHCKAAARTSRTSSERWMSEPVKAARAAYVRPSQCELCIPVIRVVGHYFENTTEAAHESGCPNHPIQHTQTSQGTYTW